jgi:pimeloyl-ACP methyl ester carboxylesterase
MTERAGVLTPKQHAEVDQLVSRNFALFLYQTGARNPMALNPDAWNLDAWALENADSRRIQAALIINYYANLDEYPKWQAYLRQYQPRTLIVWGRNDKVFLTSGAES